MPQSRQNLRERLAGGHLAVCRWGWERPRQWVVETWPEGRGVCFRVWRLGFLWASGGEL